MGIAGILGGIGLGTAMMTFIWSIINTSAAVTLLCLSAMPFITALLGFLFLKETIKPSVWFAIIVATIGVVIIALGNSDLGSLTGLIFGLASALGFSVFSVSLRWKKETPKFTTTAFAGFFCFILHDVYLLLISFLLLWFSMSFL